MHNYLTPTRGKPLRVTVVVVTALCVLFASQTTFAATFRLFTSGQQVSDYNQVIRSLISSKQPYGERTFLQFDHFPAIEVVAFLGRGGLTAVFRRADGRALRIPLASGNAFFHNGPNGELKDNGPYTNGMTSFLSAMKKLADVNALTPKIYEADSYAPEFITVDFFNAKFNIRDFFTRRNELISRGLLKPEEIPGIEDGLRRFVIRLAAFSYIGDFKVEQLMTNGKSWRLLDNSDPVRKATEFEDATPFDHKNMGPKLPPEVYSWITNLIRNERLANPGIFRATPSFPAMAKSCGQIFLK